MPLVGPNSKKTVYATVFIPTFNGEKYLERLLHAVESQDFLYNFEILVIDSGSSDRTLEIIRSHPNVRLVQIPNSEFGHGKTRNLAASISRGEYIAFLSHDSIPLTKDWLTNLISPIVEQRDKCVASFGKQTARINSFPNLKYEIKNLFLKCGPDDRTTFVGGEKISEHEYSRWDLFYSDVNSATSRKFLTKILPYRDVDYSEDLLFAKDLIDLGYVKAYVPSALVEHSNDVSISEYKKRIFDETVGTYSQATVSSSIQIKTYVCIRATKDICLTFLRISRDSDYQLFDKIRWILKSPVILKNKWQGIYWGLTFLSNPDSKINYVMSLEHEKRKAH